MKIENRSKDSANNRAAMYNQSMHSHSMCCHLTIHSTAVYIIVFWIIDTTTNYASFTLSCIFRGHARVHVHGHTVIGPRAIRVHARGRARVHVCGQRSVCVHACMYTVGTRACTWAVRMHARLHDRSSGSSVFTPESIVTYCIRRISRHFFNLLLLIIIIYIT